MWWIVRFAVFALGSSAYTKFCAFGKDVDGLLGDLGGQRLMEVACGDELDGQEQSFKSWSQQIFQVIAAESNYQIVLTFNKYTIQFDEQKSCDVFKQEKCDNEQQFGNDLILSTETVRFVIAPSADANVNITKGLSQAHGKDVFECPVVLNTQLVATDGQENRHSLYFN